MEAQVKQSLDALFAAFCNSGSKDWQVKELHTSVLEIFNAAPDFLQKLDELDELFDEHPYAENIREFVVDLLFIHFFSTDALRLDEDYLDSPEWEKIEDETIDRGTELLNLFLYLKECKEEEEEPELSHFLKEFLLVDEDEFQDEYAIYEQVIANQMLVEAEQSEIAKVSQKISSEDDIKYVFYPLMSFFANTLFDEKEFQEYLKHSTEPSYDAALLAGIYGYYNGTGIFPKSFLTCIQN